MSELKGDQIMVEELLAKHKNIELHETIHKGKLSHYWYGGTVATIQMSDVVTFEIWANGDIYAELYSDSDTVDVFVKDKRNNGTFLHEMDGYIQNDEQLYEYINNRENDKYPCLEISNNNWWELFVYKDGEEIETAVLEADLLTEAIEESLLYIIEE